MTLQRATSQRKDSDVATTGKGKSQAPTIDLDACKRPADLARALNVPGKRLRDHLRKQGIYVSRGDAFTTEAKQECVTHFTPSESK